MPTVVRVPRLPTVKWAPHAERDARSPVADVEGDLGRDAEAMRERHGYALIVERPVAGGDARREDRPASPRQYSPGMSRDVRVQYTLYSPPNCVRSSCSSARL